MKRFVLIMNLSVFCLFAFAVQGQVIHYAQNFDGLNEGDADGQGGWAVGPPADKASTTITSEVKHGATGKSMKVDPEQVVVVDFDPVIKTGVHFLSLWFRYEMKDTKDDKLFVYIGEEVREWRCGPVVYMGGNNDDPNKVTVYNGNTAVPVGDDIKVGEWQHLFEVIDIDKQTITVYVDDVLVAEDFGWRNPENHKGLGWLMFGFDRGQGTIGYYDDIIFGEGDALIVPSSVATEGKLATTWGNLKNVR